MVVTAAFFAEQIVYAAPAFPSLSLFKRQTSASLRGAHLAIPESVALVDEVYEARGGQAGRGPSSFEAPKERRRTQDDKRNASKTLYLIQDAHTNPSAQLNIAKSLEILLENKKTRWVFTEAGIGDNSLTFLRPHGLPEIRRRRALEYLRKGEFKGTEYLSLASDEDFVIWGVEDRALYAESLAAYRRTVKHQADAAAFLGRMEQTAQVLKEKLFGASLLDLDCARRSYLEGEMPFLEYLKRLYRSACFKKIYAEEFLHVRLALRAQRDEGRIDFEKAAGEYEAAKGDVSGGRYAELGKYSAYLKKTKAIDPRLLLREADALEGLVFDAHISTADQRRLLRTSRRIEKLQRLVQLKLTPEEFRTYLRRRRYGIVLMAAFLNRLLMHLGSMPERAVLLDEFFGKAVKNAERFYRLSFRRDLRFVEHALQKMEVEGQEAAVLITGGFHTPNLKSLLKARGVSYASLIPRVLHETDHGRYRRLLLGQRLGNEKKEKGKSGSRGVFYEIASGASRPRNDDYKSASSLRADAMDVLNWTLRKSPAEISAFAAEMAEDSGFVKNRSFLGDVRKPAAARLSGQIYEEGESLGIYTGKIERREESASALENLKPEAVDREALKKLLTDEMLALVVPKEDQRGFLFKRMRVRVNRSHIVKVKTPGMFLYCADAYNFQVSFVDPYAGNIYVTEDFWNLIEKDPVALSAFVVRNAYYLLNEKGPESQAEKLERDIDPEARLRWLINEALIRRRSAAAEEAGAGWPVLSWLGTAGVWAGLVILAGFYLGLIGGYRRLMEWRLWWTRGSEGWPEKRLRTRLAGLRMSREELNRQLFLRRALRILREVTLNDEYGTARNFAGESLRRVERSVSGVRLSAGEKKKTGFASPRWFVRILTGIKMLAGAYLPFVIAYIPVRLWTGRGLEENLTRAYEQGGWALFAASAVIGLCFGANRLVGLHYKVRQAAWTDWLIVLSGSMFWRVFVVWLTQMYFLYVINPLVPAARARMVIVPRVAPSVTFNSKA